jgi:hypothetical protein
MGDAESSLFLPTIGLVIATFGLVVVIIYYAIQTHRLVIETRNTAREMRTATESQF